MNAVTVFRTWMNIACHYCYYFHYYCIYHRLQCKSLVRSWNLRIYSHFFVWHLWIWKGDVFNDFVFFFIKKQQNQAMKSYTTRGERHWDEWGHVLITRFVYMTFDDYLSFLIVIFWLPFDIPNHAQYYYYDPRVYLIFCNDEIETTHNLFKISIEKAKRNKKKLE